MICCSIPGMREKFLKGYAPPVPPGPLLPKRTVTVTASQPWLLRPRGCEGRDYRTLSGAEDTNYACICCPGLLGRGKLQQKKECTQTDQSPLSYRLLIPQPQKWCFQRTRCYGGQAQPGVQWKGKPSPLFSLFLTWLQDSSKTREGWKKAGI